jgi:hypothetical protein
MDAHRSIREAPSANGVGNTQRVSPLQRTRRPSLELTMHSQHNEQSPQRRSVEFLAMESQVPVDAVAQLYESEWAELAKGARVTAFLSILATRNVRRMLRLRRAQRQASA